MLFPIRTDSPIHRTPWVNYGLIVANVIIYLVTYNFDARPDPLTGLVDPLKPFARAFLLDGMDPKIYQFFTYQFLHGGFAHIAGNMLFLWVFGNSVNAKMGNLPYLLFYIAGGVFAATGYALFSTASMLGASGAIAAVTTAYLALFPRSNIEFIYWWFIIGFIELPSVLMILLKMVVWDNIIGPSLMGGAGVTEIAYGAHLAGYSFGFVAALVLLWTRALPRDQFDIVALWRRWYHRQSLATALRDPNARARAEYGRVARPVQADGTILAEPVNDHVANLRMRIASALADRDRVTAAELYQELLQHDPQQTLPREQQLEVAYQLFTMGRMPQAATAYEGYIRQYPTAGDVDQVRLLLGIILARDLAQYEAARAYLTAAVERLGDDQRRRQAREWLDLANKALQSQPQD